MVSSTAIIRWMHKWIRKRRKKGKNIRERKEEKKAERKKIAWVLYSLVFSPFLFWGYFCLLNSNQRASSLCPPLPPPIVLETPNSALSRIHANITFVWASLWSGHGRISKMPGDTQAHCFAFRLVAFSWDVGNILIVSVERHPTLFVLISPAA